MLPQIHWQSCGWFNSTNLGTSAPQFGRIRTHKNQRSIEPDRKRLQKNPTNFCVIKQNIKINKQSLKRQFFRSILFVVKRFFAYLLFGTAVVWLVYSSYERSTLIEMPTSTVMKINNRYSDYSKMSCQHSVIPLNDCRSVK